MANIVYFEIPANDVDRSKTFYYYLLGRKIEPTKVSIPDGIYAVSGYNNRRAK